MPTPIVWIGIEPNASDFGRSSFAKNETGTLTNHNSAGKRLTDRLKEKYVHLHKRRRSVPKAEGVILG